MVLGPGGGLESGGEGGGLERRGEGGEDAEGVVAAVVLRDTEDLGSATGVGDSGTCGAAVGPVAAVGALEGALGRGDGNMVMGCRRRLGTGRGAPLGTGRGGPLDTGTSPWPNTRGTSISVRGPEGVQRGSRAGPEGGRRGVASDARPHNKTHTHIHTHTHTRARKYSLTHRHTGTHTCVQRTRAHTQTRPHTHTSTHTYTHTHTHTPVAACTLSSKFRIASCSSSLLRK